jgi:hypothetical protein
MKMLRTVFLFPIDPIAEAVDLSVAEPSTGSIEEPADEPEQKESVDARDKQYEQVFEAISDGEVVEEAGNEKCCC